MNKWGRLSFFEDNKMARLDPYADPNKTESGPFSQESTAEVFRAPTDGGSGLAYVNNANDVEPPRKLDLAAQQREPYDAPSEYSMKPGYNPYFTSKGNPPYIRNTNDPEVPDAPPEITVSFVEDGPQSMRMPLDSDGYNPSL